MLGLHRADSMRSNLLMAARRRRRPKRGEPEERAVAELPARLVYSLLKAAVGIAARSKMPMAQLTELTQLAYFEELRKQHPRELSAIAEVLGLSLRSVGSLNRRLKEAFFAAETEVQPARKVSSVLVEGPRSLAEIQRALPDLERSQVRQALAFLKESGWVQLDSRRYALVSRLRSYVDEDLTRRIDALNNQMEILAASVWSRFVAGEATAVGRSWVFAAKKEALLAFIDQTIRSLRHDAIDLEESALNEGPFERYGVTLAISRVGDET